MSKQSDHITNGWVKLQKARAFIKLKYPYFYRTVLGLIPRNIDEGTMYVTQGMVLGVNMRWYQTLEDDVAAGCLIHEVMHILRDLTRISALPDVDLAGYAFDMPINDDLRKMKIKLPPWVVYSDTHKLPPGLSGEGYYYLLAKNKIQIPLDLNVGSGKCGSCAGHEKDEDPKEGKAEGDGGSAGPNDKELGRSPKEVQYKELGRSPKEVQYFKRMGASDIREYIKKSGMQAGDIPGTWQEFLKFDDEVAIVPWQSILPTRVGEAYGRVSKGQSDYSMRRPSKRSFVYGWIRPGLISYTPCVAFIEDTSLSMGHEQIRENRVEFANCMVQMGLEQIWFLDADIDVQTKPKLITVQDLFRLPIKGRGGTDFRPSIEAVMRLNPRPELVCYSTDGCGEAPRFKPRNTEFVWLLAPGDWSKSPCDWGIQILTSNDPEDRKQYKLLA